MARVSQETIEKLNAFIDSLPTDARNKCALCNETLIHLVKTAEVRTGAGTATVTKALADKINETAAPGDRVSGEKLQDRVRYNEGLKMGNSQDNPTQPTKDEHPDPETKPMAGGGGQKALKKPPVFSQAIQLASLAISQLERIRHDDPKKIEALNRVLSWVEQYKSKENNMTAYVRSTPNYDLFELHSFNRDVIKTGPLEKSMRKHGWIDAYPMHVIKNGSGKFKIIDGHHRFEVAGKLGIRVKYIICNDSVDIIELIPTVNQWTPQDYLMSYVRAEKSDYLAIKEYMEETGIPLSLSISILAGESAGSNNKLLAFKSGKYKLGDQTHAEKIKDVIILMRDLGIEFANKSLFIQALSKMLWVKKFSVSHFKKKLSTHIGIIEKKPSLESYLIAIEQLYNRGCKARLPLAFMATEAAKERQTSFNKQRQKTKQ